MATFQKRNGRITATVRIKPHKPKSKTFDTLRDAKKWAQETEVELKNEKQLIFDHVILKDAMEEYRDTISIKKRGADREISRINYILKHMRCDIPLINVDKEFLVNWREWRLENVSSGTARRDFVLLAGFFTWCVETKLWLRRNPVRDVQMPKDSDHRERVISQDEIDKLCEYLSPDLKDIFLLAIETGMRQAEICGMTWDRVYLEKRYVKLLITKNGRPREVPLSQKAVDILSGRQKKKSGSVFNLSPLAASTEFMKARISAELYGFTFHDSRHTAATRIALKLPLLDLCKMFGWSNPKRAMTYYNPTASEIASRL
ncbi:site-specific integrase [Acinetobacter sp. SA01]|uniref:tyrosine-type recombinase/integrase n=1 Tax=Acinetobacter sp. SA01 TaxID=1862567 RepID=UPI00140B27A9|nr:site-specific integrase [Acinetobacter sp. SA01]